MELRERGMPRRPIAETRRMSVESACEAFGIAEERGIGWADVEPLTDGEAHRLFHPDRGVRESVFEGPDWGHVHEEMARVGVDLRLLHDEHGERRRREGKVAMGHAEFCGDCGTWTAAKNLTERIGHEAGRSCGVGWSGPTLGKGLASPVAGEVSKICLSVGVLPSSQMAYFEPTLDMEEGAWPKCHVRMCEYRGGVPERTACDDLKAGVVKHPREGEVVPNGAYGALGERCMTAIMPAQVKKPKRKASAGGTVRDAATWVAARLGNGAFAAIEDARAAVRRCPGACNAHPFQKREGSRDSVSAEAEAAEPGPLPDVRHDAGERIATHPLFPPPT